MHLLIDSTGIKVEGEGEWNARKHGGAKRRVWRKAHLGIDEETLEIRAVKVTSSDIGDAPMLPELLVQISTDQDIASATADGAYDTLALVQPKAASIGMLAGFLALQLLGGQFVQGMCGHRIHLFIPLHS